MIKAKELRIGNYLYVPGLDRIVRVTSIYKTHFVCEDQHGVRFEESIRFNYEPIHLTEQWLLDFGCEELVDFYDDVEKAFSYKDHYVILVDGEWFFGLEHQDFHTKIKYIHQLQNLYFALTGEELEIK